MAYTPTVWKNGEFPPIDAEHLNKIEQGIANSAPGGFGLGSIAKALTSNDDVNDIAASGWYSWYERSVPKNAINLSWVTIMRVDGHLGGVFVQTAYGVTDAINYYTQPIVARRMRYSSAIGEWEYENPPMELGIEYRTTERYLGKPVYKKLIEFPSLTGRDYQQINSNVGFAISAIGEVRSPDNTNFWVPMAVNPMAGQDDGPFPKIAFGDFYSASVGVVCASNSGYIGQPARVLVTYYKATD